MTRAILAGASLALTLLAPQSWAQTSATGLPVLDLDRIELNPSGQTSMTVGGAVLLDPGAYRAQGIFHYQQDPLSAYREGAPGAPWERLGAVVRNRLALHLTGAYAVTPNIELGAQLPVVLFQLGDNLSAAGIQAPSIAGLGSPTLTGRYGILSSSSSPLDLSAQVSLSVPIGSDTALARDGGFTLSGKAIAFKRLPWFDAGAEAGLILRPEVSLRRDRYGGALHLGGALTRAFLAGKLDAEVALRAAVPLSGLAPSVELLAGGRYLIQPKLQAFLLAGPASGSGPGTPTFRVLAGVAWGGSAQPKTASDAAPVFKPKFIYVADNKASDCSPDKPHTPQACPELDDDSDGIKNGADRCELVAEDVDHFEDSDGCPDEDNDGDSFADKIDKCPDVKGVLVHDGCPVPDHDGDAVADADDRCPSEAGPAERSGCPFYDQDQDGLEDSVDVCVAEKGPVETRGCAIKDTDGDKVSDHLDNCPKEAGLTDNAGCPAAKKQLVVLTAERIEIKDKIYFDTGTERIDKASYKLLEQIADVLKEHPALPLVVDGHTDDRGDAERNRQLSLQRAFAVKAYLVFKGIEETRIRCRGFGPDKPAADNKTAAGRDRNRRVEFNIPRAGARFGDETSALPVGGEEVES